MKKLKFFNFKTVALRVIVAICLCVATFFIPTAVIISRISLSNKLQNVSSYQGVVELWNIDTFEGGTLSKTSFLKDRAIAFEKQNKGMFVMVKNMTPEECLLALSGGQMPAMFSFGSQFAKDIEQLLLAISINCNVEQSVISSATKNSNLYAIGYAKSAYVLCSTQAKLVDQSQSISNQAFICGNKKTLKNNKTKITYSLTCGNAVCNPQMCFEQNFYPFALGETTYDATSKTAYQAYCDFVEGKANILLGTLRDVARLENRYLFGKFEKLVYQPLGGLLDMVQYIGICKKIDNSTQNACKKFIDFLLSTESQNCLKNIGLLSTKTDIWLYENDEIYCQIEQMSKTNIIAEIF